MEVQSSQPGAFKSLPSFDPSHRHVKYSARFRSGQGNNPAECAERLGHLMIMPRWTISTSHLLLPSLAWHAISWGCHERPLFASITDQSANTRAARNRPYCKCKHPRLVQQLSRTSWILLNPVVVEQQLSLIIANSTSISTTHSLML